MYAGMKKLNLHSYSYFVVQELAGDDDRRLEGCQQKIWLKVNVYENFYKLIAFSNEAVLHDKFYTSSFIRKQF